MNATEAADFLRLSENAFSRLAPTLPRCKLDGKQYRYLRSDLLEWLRSRREPDSYVDSNPGAIIRNHPHKNRNQERVKRLV
jgi:hypothetical protein